MIWSLDLDDFNGQFCGEGKFPLLATIKVRLLASNEIHDNLRLF